MRHGSEMRPLPTTLQTLILRCTSARMFKLRRLKVGTYTDAAAFSYRLDGNNVDIENENVYLAQNQIKYQGLMKSISQEFQNLQTAMRK